MSIIKKIKMSIVDHLALERVTVSTEQTAANVDYIAMMTDVELPTTEEVTDNE